MFLCEMWLFEDVLFMSVWRRWLRGVFMLFHVLCRYIHFYKPCQVFACWRINMCSCGRCHCNWSKKKKKRERDLHRSQSNMHSFLCHCTFSFVEFRELTRIVLQKPGAFSKWRFPIDRQVFLIFCNDMACSQGHSKQTCKAFEINRDPEGTERL